MKSLRIELLHHITISKGHYERDVDLDIGDALHQIILYFDETGILTSIKLENWKAQLYHDSLILCLFFICDIIFYNELFINVLQCNKTFNDALEEQAVP